MKKLLFVLNPISGGRKKEKILALVKDFCTKNNFSCHFYKTQGKDDDTKNINDLILSINPDAVVAIGGDGTINLVGELLVTTSFPLGIIPMGSANGLAKDLQIPDNPLQALEIIKAFHIHEIDALKVNGVYCFHVTDFGFNARIVRRFSKSLTRGKISYAWYGLQEFFQFEPFDYVIETDRIKVEGKAFMITVTNANRFGTNVNINPLGEIDDGFFEISVIKPFSKLQSFKVLYHLFSNSIHRSKYNKVIRCRKALIHNKDQTSFHIDGEPVPSDQKIEVTIVPKGLKVILPRDKQIG